MTIQNKYPFQPSEEKKTKKTLNLFNIKDSDREQTNIKYLNSCQKIKTD